MSKIDKEANNSQFHLVLVEDNHDHAQLIKMGLKDFNLEFQMIHFSDGLSALDYFCKVSPHQNRKTPDLVILDISLPKADGHTVLKGIRAQDELADTPVVILSTSESGQDRLQAAENEVNRYLVKPIGLEALQGMLQELSIFWDNDLRMAS